MKKLLFVISIWALPILAHADVVCNGTDTEGHTFEVTFSQITTATPIVKLHYLENSSFPVGKCHPTTESETLCYVSIGTHSYYSIHLWSLSHSEFAANLEHTLVSEPTESLALSCQSHK